MNGRYTVLALLLLLSACSDPQSSRHFVQEELEVWVHYGNEAERRTIQQQVTRFNDLQDKVRISAVILPSGIYHEQIDEAAVKGNLPDILEIDPDYVGYRAWQGQLVPIDKLLSDSLRLDLLRSLLQQNMYLGRIYALSPNGRIDILYARRSLLDQAGITLPSPANSSHREQLQILNDLLLHLADKTAAVRHSGDRRAAIIETNSQQGEQWLSEMLLPLLMAGFDKSQPLSAAPEGKKTLAMLQQIRHWYMAGYFDDQPGDAFIQGRVPLAIATQAELEQYHQAWKDDLVAIPLTTSVSGQAHNDLHPGWSWGISRDCRDLRTAMRFIEFLLQPEEILMMADASATVPASRSALQMSSQYQGDQSGIDALLLERDSIRLTASPAYPQLRTRIDQLIKELSHGQDARQALMRIQADFAAILAPYQDEGPEQVSTPLDTGLSSTASASD